MFARAHVCETFCNILKMVLSMTGFHSTYAQNQYEDAAEQLLQGSMQTFVLCLCEHHEIPLTRLF